MVVTSEQGIRLERRERVKRDVPWSALVRWREVHTDVRTSYWDDSLIITPRQGRERLIPTHSEVFGEMPEYGELIATLRSRVKS